MSISCARPSTDARISSQSADAMMQCELVGGQTVCIRIADDAAVYVAQWEARQVRRTSYKHVAATPGLALTFDGTLVSAECQACACMGHLA
jgi:hypothetical protein